MKINNLLIQWDSRPVLGSRDVTLPISYTNTGYYVFGTCITGGSYMGTLNQTTSSFSLNVVNTHQWTWFTFGY